MSLPETIWWCVQHKEHRRFGRTTCWEWGVLGGFGPPCRMVEVELHPVGSRVAGPDDLLIRREADGSWPPWAIEVIDALVAAGGGEGT